MTGSAHRRGVWLHTIIGLFLPDNVASISVLEKCGLAFVDRIPLWGMELSRYRIKPADSIRK